MKGPWFQLLPILCCCGPLDFIRAEDAILPELHSYMKARVLEFSEIPHERKELLQEISDFIRMQRNDGQTARMTFVCTHNSRRSHFAQLWAKAAACYYDLDAVETYSGGTEATAFNPRSVQALKRAGFDITKSSGPDMNPHYAARFLHSGEPEDCFSKVYDSPPNPIEDFCAVMTCSEADQSCPHIRGCERRVAVPYVDPSVSDNTPQESETYDERCSQIAREMLYVMSRVVAE